MSTNTHPPKRTAMQNRRYYLHRKLRKAGIDYVPGDKTVFIPFDQVESPLPAAVELRDKYHYSLQLIID